MKVNFNLIDLKTVKHQHCENCFFNSVDNFHFCALLPSCTKDSQIYIPTQEFFEV